MVLYKMTVLESTTQFHVCRIVPAGFGKYLDTSKYMICACFSLKADKRESELL